MESAVTYHPRKNAVGGEEVLAKHRAGFVIGTYRSMEEAMKMAPVRLGQIRRRTVNRRFGDLEVHNKLLAYESRESASDHHTPMRDTDIRRQMKEIEKQIEVKRASLCGAQSVQNIEALTRDIRNLMHKLKALDDRLNGKDEGVLVVQLPSSISNKLNFR